MKKQRIQYIYDTRIYNYLWENGVKPMAEDEHRAAYRRTPQFIAALERFQLEFYVFPNKHA